MRKVQIKQVEDGLGITLPEDVVARLGLEPGQALALVPLAEGIALTRPEAVEAADMREELEAAQEIMRRYEKALRELAR